MPVANHWPPQQDHHQVQYVDGGHPSQFEIQWPAGSPYAHSMPDPNAPFPHQQHFMQGPPMMSAPQIQQQQAQPMMSGQILISQEQHAADRRHFEELRAKAEHLEKLNAESSHS
jgi:hypothetical protein